MSSINRRSILKTAAATSAALTLPQFHYASEGSATLKLALVGCGGRGTHAIQQFLNVEGVSLVAMADVFADKVEQSLERIHSYGSKNVQVTEETKFAGFAAYKHAIDLADVVILATPPGFRPEHFEYAVNQGKHVFMEKPVAVDATGIKRVLASAKVADEKNLKVVCGLQRRYQPSYLKAYKEVHEQNLIGDIVSMSSYWISRRPWNRGRTENQTELEFQIRNWYYFNWLCGDHILEQHIHNIDVCNWFKGALPISARAVSGIQQQDLGSNHGQIWDHHVVEFFYEDGSQQNSFCRQIDNCWEDISETLVGTTGTLKLSPGNYKVFRKGVIETEHRGRGEANPFQEEINALFSYIREDVANNDAYYGATSTFSAILGRDAGYSGTHLTWNDLLENGLQLIPTDTSNWTLDTPSPLVPDAQTGLYPTPFPGKTTVMSN